ncbi:unnamed protein product [Camellia sinensis]
MPICYSQSQLQKNKNNGKNSKAVNGVIRRAADAITNLAHENSSIKTCVRIEGGILPPVELLEFIDSKVQRAEAGALRTLAFKNDENKNIVECNALHTLILLLRSEDAAIHYEAVGVIGNLVHSSPNIKREVLLAGALQPHSARRTAPRLSDIENCQVPKGCDPHAIAQNISSALVKMNYCGPVSISAYGDTTGIPSSVQASPQQHRHLLK